MYVFETLEIYSDGTQSGFYFALHAFTFSEDEMAKLYIHCDVSIGLVMIFIIFKYYFRLKFVIQACLIAKLIAPTPVPPIRVIGEENVEMTSLRSLTGLTLPPLPKSRLTAQHNCILFHTATSMNFRQNFIHQIKKYICQFYLFIQKF